MNNELNFGTLATLLKISYLVMFLTLNFFTTSVWDYIITGKKIV